MSNLQIRETTKRIVMAKMLIRRLLGSNQNIRRYWVSLN